jgi:GT2 family glycosyltransferase/SAM-dependent methyltransferase
MKAERYYEYERSEILEAVPFGAERILDVGCGSGWLGEQLKRRQGALVCGVEIVPEAAERAAQRLDRVWNASVEEVLSEIPENSFDCIITADVLEHLGNPWAVLTSLRQKLAPGGTVVASVPNVGHWDVVQDLLEGTWHYTSEGLLDRTHLRFFTRRSVQELFWTAGLTIREFSAIPRGHGMPPALLKRLRRAGLRMTGGLEDLRVFQYLVVAERRALPAPWPRIGIVVLNYSDGDDTAQCLESIRSVAYAPFETIVVDRESAGSVVPTDPGTRSADIDHLKIRADLAYGDGYNLGIQHALERGAGYVLLLSNRALLDRDSLERLVETATMTPEAGLWGPRIYGRSHPDTVWGTGFKWNPVQLSFAKQGEGDPAADVDTVHMIDALTDCAMLIRRDVVERVGMLKPEYSPSWAVIDFCTRATEQGFKPVVVPTSRVWYTTAPSVEDLPISLQAYVRIRNRLTWARQHLRSRHVRAIWHQEFSEIRRKLPPMPPWRSGTRKLYWWMLEVARECRSSPARDGLRALFDELIRPAGNYPAAIRKFGGEPSPPSSDVARPS